ncbi:AAC(3) family N-acetyltransferase [Vagococcus zengguangii]|uniref:Aminoglycoside N(3)-acetyltransferase n=1 Tax=Vagococcus zengguangii TaxID=2571750 RepID=A0A4D7CS71_9ENTE|nr:AAC(3) family N-acetyltransferase [Vagococcus zengguangii]QCI85724.1 AAC(3) family N-acetyltransferase [Vagococcus zengguangii]TLG81665.1 AAC(3) family N-acetyltransferase [Vagococcus zengguangii]
MRYQQLVKDLSQLGIKKSDIIVVHSSFNAIRGKNNSQITPLDVIKALQCTVSEGTLMIPTLSYESVRPEEPIFNLNETPACIGIIPETMRHVPNTFRSLHPTHSVTIWGKDAEKIAQQHQYDFSPVGANSPFREVKRRQGKIVMLGAPLARNTSLHGVEEMIQPDYLFRKHGTFRYDVILPDKTITIDSLRHDFSQHTQRYDRVLDLLSPDEYQYGKVIDADCYVMEAEAVWEKALAKLKEDIYYFVDKKE